jgi:hypothetical protein
MTARVLVVDDVRSNRKLLQTRLSLEYFESSRPGALPIEVSGPQSRHSGRGVTRNEAALAASFRC